MEIIDYTNELVSFYEKYKDSKIVLSNEEIQKIMKKWMSTSSYNLLSHSYKNYEIIFGLDNGLCFTKDKILQPGSSKDVKVLEYSYDFLPIKILSVHPSFEYSISESQKITPIFFNLKEYEKIFDKINTELLGSFEEKITRELHDSQNDVLIELDKDGDGKVDIVDGNEFSLLLQKHQKSIVEVDRNYVQQFVKVSSYLKTKRGNIQSVFDSIKDTPNKEILNECVDILKDEMNTYNLLLFNSLNMVVSLVEDDMITFYEIYEMFDKLNIFDSKHERDVSQRLTNIGDGIVSLLYELRSVGNQITDSIGELSYVTETSNQKLTERLLEVDSSLQVNNFLTAIQTYQLNKINKSTRNLRG
ncbi:MAG: hypothetical protein FJX80_05065 [Bacteroidetes bacterium]|nr:hypothetical protein [Bacteroidota bacterium]